MKKFTTLVAILLLCVTALFAQAPEKFSYQAVVRNANNQLVTNTLVGVRVSILQGNATGTPVYVETHTATTNANGLLTVQIGGGNAQQGAFAAINWEDGPYFLKTETDPNGGTNYSVTSTQQLLSVPYALYAKEVANSFSGDYNDLTNKPEIPTVPSNVSAFNNDVGYITGYTETDPQYNAWNKDYNDLINRPTIPTVPTNVSAFNNDAGYITNADIPDIPTVPTNVSAFVNDVPYLTSYTEQQVLSISNDTIFLTGGSFVKLPPATGFSGDYNDLTNTPTIPTVPANVSAFNNDVGYITGYTETDPQYNAWNKDYNDLINRPTIPTVPINVSAFTNDAGYITGYTETDPQFNAWGKDYNDLINTPQIPTVPTNVSAFTNDAGYITNADIPEIPTVPTNVSAFVNDVPYLTSFTEQQVLSISNDTIFLTGGSFVKLPAGFSGDYNDLVNKPEIPRIPDIPTVPDSVSAFTNDAGYITMADLQALLDELNALNDRIDSLENLVNNQAPTTQDTVDAQPCPGVPTVTDIDGNVYNTVQIGQQCWMKENLRTQHYADGTDVQDVQVPSYMPQYGYLYDWSAVMHGEASSITAPSGVQGICPNGWHLPSETEWTQLTDYVGGQSEYICGGNSNNVAKALASASGWASYNGVCCVGNSPWTNNATGFSALPVGTVENGETVAFGDGTIFRTATNMIFKEISAYNSTVSSYAYSSVYASVRCVLGDASDTSDVFTPTLPEMQTDSVTDVTSTSAVVGGRILSNGGSGIAVSGLVWGVSPNPDYTDGDWSNTIYNEEETVHFTGTLTGLDYSTTYYVRAFAVNMSGIVVYGNEVSFTTNGYEHVCPGMPKVTDVDGNIYNTIQVGNQCWMKENLRTTHYANGSVIETIPTSSIFEEDYSDKYYGDMARATKKITDVNSTILLQGVCPDGWHLPTIAEWEIFMDNNTFGTGYNSDFGSDCSFWTGVGNYSYDICEGTYSIRSYSYTINSWGGNIQPVRCVRGDGVNVPSVHLDSISGITMYTASYSAEVLGGNGLDVTDRGICWATTPKPTTSNNTISHHVGLNNVGTFSGIIGNGWPSLSPGNTYYVRAYATNYLGTTYSNEIAFTTLTEIPDTSTVTPQLPMVKTGLNGNLTIYNVTSTSAISGCEVVDDGGAEITDQGLCWGTTPHPTLYDNYVSGSNYLTNLDSCTTYYVRAYAVNSVGIAYGNEVTFNTLCNNPVPNDGQPCSEAPTLTDVDNNTYNTVQIGNQCWMKENLRCTHYANGDTIAVTNPTTGTVETVGYGYPANAINPSGVSIWNNPTGPQSVCPDGWHLPSPAEWNQLISYVGSQSDYICGAFNLYHYSDDYGNDSYDYNFGIARALSAGSGWQFDGSWGDECSPSYDFSANNATGFSAIPAAEYTSGGNFADFAGISKYLRIGSEGAVVLYNGYSNYGGVRCLKGEGATNNYALDVTTAAVSQITDSTAVSGGEVSGDTSVPVTERGVCWSQWNEPTTDDHHAVAGSGTGSFTADLTGLLAGTTYYVRAYAVNEAGTSYGNVQTFTTTGQQAAVGQDGQPCPDAATVSDYDGNTYATVQIGNQCWMKENLRTTHYADGTEIPADAGTWSYESVDNASRFAPDGDEANVPVYGYLYNWSAVMNGANSTNANPSGVQGVCPDGWHVPSDAEWTQLTDYLLGQNAYVCGESSVAKALADTLGWQASEVGCSPGINISTNNTTGFSMRPAGEWRINNYRFGQYAEFWTATENENEQTWLGAVAREFINYIPSFEASPYFNKNDGYSVRCVKGQGASLPTVITGSLGFVKDTTAWCGVETTSNGGSDLIQCGLCVSSAHIPTVSDYCETVGPYLGYVGALIEGLTPGTTYYVRAFATNAVGTAYGEVVSFTTLSDSTAAYAPCQGTPSVSDYEGNFYNTVQIGDQCWMRDNLRSTRYADGQSMYEGYWEPNGDASLVEQYGYLYNWSAVMHGAEGSDAYPSGVQGICPNGWHVPSKTEWETLIAYVGSQDGNVCGGNADNIAKALASKTGWFNDFTECTVGNNPSQNNATGFCALPAGGSGTNLASGACFWTCSQYPGYYQQPWFYSLTYESAAVMLHYSYDNYDGMSVRCIRTESATAPSVSTLSVTTNSDSLTVTATGEVTSDGHAEVSRGICWSTAQYPTLSPGLSSPYVHGISQPAGTGVGVFSVNLPGLQSGHTYYVRAYAYNTSDTVYGDQLTVTPAFNSAGASCPESNRVIDKSGNVYPTVQIGNQCWMKSNLRTTRYANGSQVASSGWWYPNGDESNKASYGLLYSWTAVMNGASSSSANPSGVQGICPTGWHVPSQGEWQQLSDYETASGSTLDGLGFALVNAGSYYSSYGYNGFGQSDQCYYWSSTEVEPDYGYYTSQNAYYSTNGWSATSYSSKAGGLSVRCVLNQTDMNPTVTTEAATGVEKKSVVLHANVNNPYNVVILEKGFEWKASNLTDYYDTFYVNSGEMAYSVSGLSANVSYTYRAFVTTVLGKVYGNEMTVSTLTDDNPCEWNSTISYNGSNYHTVAIGSQCWMKENLRTAHYADGTPIEMGSYLDSEVAYRYYPNSISTTVSTYGYLYNWMAVMGESTPTNKIPSGVQGICPNGWHVPSTAEWEKLKSSVSGQEVVVAKALAASSGWNTSSNTNAVGTNQANTNNASGFTALPAGAYSCINSSWSSCAISGFGEEAHFWSATVSGDSAHQYYMNYNSTYFTVLTTPKHYAFSVRCLKD